MIRFLPDLPPPFRRSAKDSFTETPFTDDIVLVDLPHKFTTPRFRTYDSTTDPDDHIAHYCHAMLTTSLPREIRKARFYKLLNLLSGLVLEWYVNLPVGTIDSF